MAEQRAQQRGRRGVSELSDLIARLEAATAGSRELDARVIAYLVGGDVAQSPINLEWCVYRGTDRRGEPALWEPRSGEKWLPRHSEDNGPTRSIDAALTLVPEGWWFHISHIEASVCPTSPVEDAGRALNGDWALTNALQYDDRGKPVYQKSLILHDRKRTALAICIAALRARMKE